jgi:hypothetical protein
VKQIQDTPRNECAICEEYCFSKNIRCFNKELKKEYMSLITYEKTITHKRGHENGKPPQFATPD